jgi:hypothetical protein
MVRTFGAESRRFCRPQCCPFRPLGMRTSGGLGARAGILEVRCMTSL